MNFMAKLSKLIIPVIGTVVLYGMWYYAQAQRYDPIRHEVYRQRLIGCRDLVEAMHYVMDVTENTDGDSPEFRVSLSESLRSLDVCLERQRIVMDPAILSPVRVFRRHDMDLLNEGPLNAAELAGYRDKLGGARGLAVHRMRKALSIEKADVRMTTWWEWLDRLTTPDSQEGGKMTLGDEE